MKKEIKNYYVSSDLPLVVTLALSHPIASVNNDNPKRIQFSFLATPHLQQLVSEYLRGEVRIEPREFFMQMRNVKSLLYDNSGYAR